MLRTRLKPDRRSAVLLGAALVGIMTGGGMLLYQQESSLADVAKQLKAKEGQRDESTRVASRLAETELRFKEDTEHLKFLESALPSAAYVPTLLRQIEQLCKDTNNEVRAVRPEAAPPKPVRPAVRRTDPEAPQNDDKPKEEAPKPEPYDRLTIDVSVTGGFQEYQNLLQRLTQFPKIVAVDKVQLRPRMDNDHPNASPRLDVDMQLTAFILKDAPVAGSQPTAGTLPGSAPASGQAAAPGKPPAAVSATGTAGIRGVG
jgi:Tfp pilus assembly protein PilO